MIGKPGDKVVQISWIANPFRGDKFEAAWGPVAEAALDYGATAYAFFRSSEDRLQFTQLAVFEDKPAFERYWYSEEVAEARAAAAGIFQIPVVPEWHEVIDAGARQTEAAQG